MLRASEPTCRAALRLAAMALLAVSLSGCISRRLPPPASPPASPPPRPPSVESAEANAIATDAAPAERPLDVSGVGSVVSGEVADVKFVRARVKADDGELIDREMDGLSRFAGAVRTAVEPILGGSSTPCFVRVRIACDRLGHSAQIYRRGDASASMLGELLAAVLSLPSPSVGAGPFTLELDLSATPRR